jgi:methylenetetrahydrofolate reductase (NADPH)
VRPGGYSPDALILGLAPLLADPAANVHGFHVYTFNAIESTEKWRHEMLASLG